MTVTGGEAVGVAGVMTVTGAKDDGRLGSQH